MAIEKIMVAATVAAGLGIGSLWPSSHRPPAPSAAKELTLSRSSDGHFYADAEVNGAPVHFLVDTGSSMIALSEDDAKRAGITVEASDFSLLGEGASGLVRGKETTLSKLQLGAIEQRDVKAAVIEGASTSLLGAEFLDTVDEITIRKGRMVLKMAS